MVYSFLSCASTHLIAVFALSTNWDLFLLKDIFRGFKRTVSFFAQQRCDEIGKGWRNLLLRYKAAQTFSQRQFMMASASHALFVCKSPLCSRKLLTQRRRDAHNPINYIFVPIIYAKGASSQKGEKQNIAKYIMPCFISFIKHWQAKNYEKREKKNELRACFDESYF
jgi:hypothetical protein